jgi:hypothetical protein
MKSMQMGSSALLSDVKDMDHEYEPLHETSELAQGDLIQWQGANYVSPLHTFGIVVTADCDLEHKKFRGTLSYIPALITLDYLWYQWRPAVFSDHLNKSIVTMTQRLNNWREKNISNKSLISNEAIQIWLSRADRDTILDELGVQDKQHRNSLAPVIDKALSLFKLCQEGTPDLSALKNNYSHIRQEYNAKPQILAVDFQKAISTLPGDVFHIPALPDNSDDGLFLILRDISQCPLSDIAQTPDDLRFGAAKARRIARISAPYRYAITQNLARVFADIGLPKAYEARRSNAATRFFSFMGG